jgi:hypothetical protein
MSPAACACEPLDDAAAGDEGAGVDEAQPRTEATMKPAMNVLNMNPPSGAHAE